MTALPAMPHTLTPRNSLAALRGRRGTMLTARCTFPSRTAPPLLLHCLPCHCHCHCPLCAQLKGPCLTCSFTRIIQTPSPRPGLRSCQSYACPGRTIQSLMDKHPQQHVTHTHAQKQAILLADSPLTPPSCAVHQEESSHCNCTVKAARDKCITDTRSHTMQLYSNLTLSSESLQ